jgi:hypothetical protein
MPSKRQEIDRMIRRAIRQAIAARALYNPEDAAILKRHAEWIGIDGAEEITGDPYRMKELADIMAWKKRPRNE